VESNVRRGTGCRRSAATGSMSVQWPAAGLAGALGAPLAPVQEPVEGGGEHTRGLAHVLTRGRILCTMFITGVT